MLKEIRSCKNKILGGSITANDLQTSGLKQLLSMLTSVRMFGPLVVTVIARKLASSLFLKRHLGLAKSV